MILLLLTHSTLALNNGLGLTPGMGWNSDYCTNCSHGSSAANGFQNEAFIKHIADSMVSLGFRDLGYSYVNMDASWDTDSRDPTTGDLVPDPALWPSGLNATVEYVHAQGLGFGLYGDKGTLDCAKHPGSLGHEAQDAAFLARHGVDWWKEDSCYSSSGDHAKAIGDYAKMRDALNATGRAIWFALCGWETFYATDTTDGGGAKLGNSWRVGPDTGTGWSSVLINVDRGLEVAAAGIPGRDSGGAGGAWSDGSLLLTPGMGHGDANLMSIDRFKSMFGLWCVMGYNLLLTGNLTALSPVVLDTWRNKELIRINQDAGAGLPFRADTGGCFHAGCREGDGDGAHASYGREYAQARVAECGGEPELQQWTFDAPAAGFVRNNASGQCLNVMGCGREVIYDGCTTVGGTCAGTGQFSNEQWRLFHDGAADRSLRTQLPDVRPQGRGTCVQADASGLLSLAECNNGSASQQFRYDNVTSQLTTMADGRCLTAQRPAPAPTPSAPSTLIVARALAGGDVALLLLNNGGADANVTCDAACFGKLGLAPSETAPVEAMDLWASAGGGGHADLVAPHFSVALSANGSCAVFRLSPRAGAARDTHVHHGNAKYHGNQMQTSTPRV